MLATDDHDVEINVQPLQGSCKHSLGCAGGADSPPGVHPPELAELTADACAVRPAGGPRAPQR